MNPNTLETALLVVGVLIVILLAAILLMQIMRASVFRIAQTLLRVTTAPNDELDKPVQPLATPEHDREHFILEAGDFEAAVAAERRREGISVADDLPPPPGVPAGSAPSRPPEAPAAQAAPHPHPVQPIPPEQGHPLHPR